MKSILIFAAHPDDEVLGLGGTIAKFANNGYSIHLSIITDGSSTQYKNSGDYNAIIDEKQKETLMCSKILGIKTIDYGGFPDMKLDTVPHVQLNDYMESLIKKYKPDVVFTHFFGDVNKDHRLVFDSTMVACRPFPGQCVKTILCYKTPSSSEWNNVTFESNVFVCIDDFIDIKKEAISCYSRELREFPHPRSIQSILNIDSSCGCRIGKKYAEEFILVRDIYE